MAEAAKKTAEILVYGVIDELWGIGSAWFAEQMAAAEAEGAEEVVVRINSVGGSVFEGIAIYNIIAGSSLATRAVVDGLAASAASIILQGADVREMRRGAFVMVHNPSGIVMGESRDMRKTADDLDAIAGGLIDIYAASTGKDAPEIQDLMDAETWFGASDAVDAGFADEVLKNSRAKVAPRNQVVVMRGYRNLPEAVAKMAGIVASNEAEAAPEGEAPAAVETEDPEPAAEPEPAPPPEPQPVDPPAPAPDTISATYARAITAACVQAGMADRIEGYIEARTPVETVNAQLLAALCQAQEAAHVNGRKPVNVTGGDPHKWEGALAKAGAFVN